MYSAMQDHASSLEQDHLDKELSQAMAEIDYLTSGGAAPNSNPSVPKGGGYL